MIVAPFLAELAARWAIARVSAGRFLNGHLLTAIGIVAAFLGLIILVLWLRYDAVALNDATWKLKHARAWAAALQQQSRRDAAAEAAANEVRRLEAALAEEKRRADQLETVLGDMEAHAGQQPFWPRNVVRELRK